MFEDQLDRLKARENLSADETRALFECIFEGKATEEEIKSLLLAFAEKGETSDEIFGAAQSMRASMRPYAPFPGAIDIVGTGGDKLGTLNISTATAILAAATGVPVAKHGNRAASSLSGSSDVLAALGVNLEPSDENLARCLPELGIVFLFAPRHHPAMRHVAAARRALGRRTIFNFLGPLTNPASVKRALIGVSQRSFMKPMGETLIKLGMEKAWLVTGADGMDEISTTGLTHVLEVNKGEMRFRELDPAAMGIARVPLSELQGGDASENAARIQALFDGQKDAYRDVVLLNAAAALFIADKTPSLAEGFSLAAHALDKGLARAKLNALIELTTGRA